MTNEEILKTTMKIIGEPFRGDKAPAETHVRMAVDHFVYMLDLDRADEREKIIEFGMYLTGHDRETILQMYNDWNQ